jgi:hypothetical protein
MGAAFVSERYRVMPRSESIRLREAEAPQPLHEAKVIDAQFRIIGRKRRALGVAWKAMIAVFWAAVIGFLIPPAWIFFETIGAYFAAN